MAESVSAGSHACQTGTTAPARRTPETWVVLWFAVLMLGTLAIRLADPTGWVGSDDAAYHSAAEHIMTGIKIERVHHHYARMAMIVPIVASIAVFGESPDAVVFPTVLASVMCVMMVAILGRLVWGWWEGLCAATIIAVLPSFRVYSTTAYPDVHACFWVSLAVVLALLAVRAKRRQLVWPLGLACGLALGLAASVKVFSIAACIPVAIILWGIGRDPSRRRTAALTWVVLGGLVILVADGLFYSWAADDFLFKYHAVTASRHDGGSLLRFNGFVSYGMLILGRVTMPFRSTTSTWGLIGLAFWPVACYVLWFRPRERVYAVWALCAYLLVALAPFTAKGVFQARQVMTAAIPFALCVAWATRRTLNMACRPVWVSRGWPVLMLGIWFSANMHPEVMGSYRAPHSAKLGRAIEEVIASRDWNDDREIFVHPSLYMRYRILFPDELRSRLRIAVDEGSPSWWRHVTIDSESRAKPLPSPNHAYLLATPAQLRAEPELWDYYVTLPLDTLESWSSLEPLAEVALFDDETIRTTKDSDANIRQVLVVLVGDVS